MHTGRRRDAGMGDNLRALADRVWGPNTDCSPVVVTMDQPPAGCLPVETYAVVPHPARARLLVPLGSRRAATAALWRYNAMKAPKTRMIRTSLAAGFSAGVGERFFRHLVVSVDRRVAPEELGEWLLLRHFAAELDTPTLLASMTVRRNNPNTKPTLQLFDPSGGAIGYAKLGWSPATRSMVRTESQALAALGGRLDRVVVPRLLAAGERSNTVYSIASPLPAELHRWTQDPASAPGHSLEVARSAGVSESRLAGSGYARQLRCHLDATASGAPESSRILSAWLDRLEDDPTPLAFGRWHGDWVSWNLGRVDGRVAAWDWEHSAADVPIGFDLLHWHFQHRLASADLARAIKALDLSVPALSRFGVSRPAQPLVASLYLLEMFLRAARLSVGGGGWNPKVYPAMLEVASVRDRSHTRGRPVE